MNENSPDLLLLDSIYIWEGSTASPLSGELFENKLVVMGINLLIINVLFTFN